MLEQMLAKGTRLSLPTSRSTQEMLVGSSEAIRSVQKTIGLLADSEATVLITGETGTGKELVAHAIHDFGRRKAGPFVAVNCASIPSELIESELFGHVRGAFTGAVAERTGAFRQADHGTLLLDEIGDMDLAVQAKILRVLQERIVTPVGGKPIPIDVRVIAATHRDLMKASTGGRLSGGPLLSAACCAHSPAAIARANRRHRADRRAFPERDGTRQESVSRRRSAPHPISLARQRTRAQKRHGARRRDGTREAASRPPISSFSMTSSAPLPSIGRMKTYRPQWRAWRKC